MAAPKARKIRALTPNTKRRVSTFRMFDQDRQLLSEFSLKLGLLMEPKRQVSRNEALLHMIEHSDAILQALTRRGSERRISDAVPNKKKRVSTFRMFDEHRQLLSEFALKLGLLMDPKRQLSRNEAIPHMIEHSDAILDALARRGSGRRLSDTASAAAAG